MWLGSKLFAAGRGIGLRRFQRLSIKSCEKILSIDTRFFVYLKKFNCRGGRSGKILKIWSEAFESKERAEAFLRAYEKALSEGMREVEFEAWAWGVSEAEIKARKNELERAFKEGLKADFDVNALKSDEAFFKESEFICKALKSDENAKSESLKGDEFAKSKGLKSFAREDKDRAALKSDEESKIKHSRAYKELEKEALKGLACQGGKQKATTFTTFTTLRKNGALKGVG